MSYTQKDNSGSLFPNDRKEQDNHPDFKGKALIKGEWFWVSSWDKDGSKGPWRSLSFQPMTPEQVAKYTGATTPVRSTQSAPQQPKQRTGGYGGDRYPEKPVPISNDKQFDDSDIPF